MIVAKNIRKYYGTVRAVDGISFEVKRGEMFGFLGPNGAGKTTTVNILAGILKPDSGDVKIDGVASPGRKEARLHLGNAPQALALYDELSGEENLAFFGRLYSLSGRTLRNRIDWALEFVGLAERRRDRVKTYSGGMQRRLNLACALLHDPQVLLLDEPTVGVDPQSRNLIFEKIEALKKLDRTILYTTHYMEEAERLCDRVAVIDHGKLLAMDTVDNLITQYGGDSVVEAELASPVEDLSLPGIISGTKLRVETTEPLEIVGELARSCHRFVKISVDRADLESVFLNLTGRKLRD